MRWTVGHKISLSFLIVMVLSLTICLVLCLRLSQMLNVGLSADSALLVIDQLGELEARMIEADANLRGFLRTGAPDDAQRYRQALVEIDATLQKLDGMDDDVERKHRFARLRHAVEAQVAAIQQAALGRQSADDQVALTNESVSSSQTVRRVIGALKEEELRHHRVLGASARRDVQATQLAALIGIFLSAALAAMMAYLLIRDIARPLRALTVVARRAAAGDLTLAPAVGSRQDELGELCHAFVDMGAALRDKTLTATAISRGELGVRPTLLSAEDELGLAFISMVENLQGTLANLKAGSLIMSEVASTVSVGTEQVVEAANETASATQQLAAVVDELRHTTEQTSRSMEHISDRTRASAEATQQGEVAVRDVSRSMDDVQKWMAELAERAVQLTEKSLTISRIIGAVDDLAEQSAILAVNASLEAAHAQEQGKGFAVVAAEIHDLAGQSKQAVQGVRATLVEIQRLISGLAAAAEKSSLSVKQGVSRSEVAGAALAHISGIVEANLGVAKSVAAQALKQAAGVGQIAATVKQIHVAASDNLLSMQHIKLATDELEQAGHRLQGQIAVFKV